ncbi:MAG: S8 family serine peptidase, partial [Candidatus Sericytochromatia bacterium]|nr:S8 family serine peptidase [Candidatus Sericytochromatia bacterium]
NMNLFYELHFAETQDVWELIDQLQRLPFIEEAYPRFVLAEPQTPPSPSASPSASPSYFSPAEVNPGGDLTGIYTSPSPTAVPYDLWLRSTRIMNQNAGLASPLPAPSAGDLPHEGAWDITRGVPSVKIAAIEHGAHLIHEDLAGANIQQLANIAPDPTYDAFYHGTQTLGTLGAIHNDAANPPLGRGSVGVAHDASIWHVWAWDNHRTASLKTKSLCRGSTNGGVNCNPTVDALSWAANNWANAADKVKVILVEGSGGGENPGTIEQIDPAVFTFIKTKLVPQGISVVLPAGNRPCESIARRTGTGPTSPENPAFIACRTKFPAGKDLRLTTVTETIPAWKDACEPPNAAWAFLPGIGPIILGAYIIGYGNCIDSNKTMVVDKKTVPMPDSGAIVVGGIDVHGARMIPPEASSSSPRILPMNYGKTNPADPSSGHGVDISGPAQFIATSSYNLPSPTNSDYRDYGGSSGAPAVVAGVVALMYSANPNLSPAEVRDILRQTQQALPSGEDTAGMVNAHAAVCQAASKGAGPLPAACQGFGGKSFSIASQRPDNAPAHVQFWLLNNGQRVALEPGELVGIAFDSGNLVNLQVQLGNQTLPLLELAENYAIYGIPQNLPQGLYNVLLSLGGESETLTQALEVLTDCRSDEVLTDTSWIWYQEGSPRQAVVSPFFLGRVKILPTPEGQRPAPIWSVLNSQSRATCVDCTFDFFKTYTLPAGYQVRYGQIAAQSDDRARFFVNQTLIGESTYSFGRFGSSSVPWQFTLPSALFASGQQAVNLQIQGWNKISAANDNYAGVAAKFTLRSCRR